MHVLSTLNFELSWYGTTYLETKNKVMETGQGQWNYAKMPTWNSFCDTWYFKEIW